MGLTIYTTRRTTRRLHRRPADPRKEKRAALLRRGNLHSHHQPETPPAAASDLGCSLSLAPTCSPPPQATPDEFAAAPSSHLAALSEAHSAQVSPPSRTRTRTRALTAGRSASGPPKTHKKKSIPVSPLFLELLLFAGPSAQRLLKRQNLWLLSPGVLPRYTVFGVGGGRV